MKNSIGILRILFGWYFLWAFIDKVFGLGFATEYGKAWVDGVSPTYGFLMFGTKGPFVEFFHSIAGTPIVDYLFMFGLLGIGTSLLLGIGVRIATLSGVTMFGLMFIAGFIPPEHNPIIDEHIIYAVTLIVLAYLNAGNYLGLGKWWSQTRLVKKMPFLK